MKHGDQQVEVRVSAGSRAAEDSLVSYLQGHALSPDSLRRGISQPLRLIVPSAALRTHLSSRLVTRRGRPLLGVRIQTLYGYAREVLEAAGQSVRPAGGLEAILVERAARATPRVGPALSELSEGFRAPVRSVRDLLDAGGLGGASLDAATTAEGSAELAGSALRGRSLDVLSIARDTASGARAAGLDLTGAILSRAAQQIASGRSSLPCRGLLVFGFSDATGVATELLSAALAEVGGAVFVDLPPGVGPGRENQLEVGNALRTAAGFGGAPGAGHPSVPEASTIFDGFGARGPEGEVQECARRVRRMIDQGFVPERIGLVASSLDGYGTAIRRQFDRLGIPFAFGAGQAPPPPLARWQALPSLLDEPANFPADEFVDLLGSLGGRTITPSCRVRLRVALRTLGYSRLGQLADPAACQRLPDAEGVRLPLVRGLEARLSGSPATASRLRTSTTDLRALFSVAQSFVEGSGHLPESGPLERWLPRILAGVGLLDSAPPQELLDALAGIPSPPGFEVSRSELISLVKDSLVGLGRGSLGGPGAGVALLSVREARSWTFDHLFLLGTNRGAFPKVGSDDPLLPERERRVLRSSLPHLPRVAGQGALERYGVAQLLSSSPRVTLVWQTVDAGGKAGMPSPLVSYLLTASGGEEPLPEARSSLPAELPSPSPVGDYLMRAGLYGSRDEVRRLLPLALSTSVLDPQESKDWADLARGRLGVLDEVDPDLQTDEGAARWAALGPFLGQVGGMVEPADPRRRHLSAHSLEGLATCPWRSFLTGYLGLKEWKDPGADIPQVDARLVGILVHQVLEDLVCELGLSAGGALADVLEIASGVRLPPPSDDRLAEACLLASRALLMREGLLLPGLAELLQRRALGFLVQAFADGPLPPTFGEDGAAAVPSIIGVEIDGKAEVAGHTIAFRADRVDRCGDELVFVDYKSGAALSDAVRQSTRDKAYFEAVSQGRKLQAAIYASAAGPLRSSGRYLFLRPDLSEGARRVEHDPSDAELSGALESTVALLATGLHEGQLFPRLVGLKDQKEPGPCGRCSVSSACVRGDSSARGRLVRYAAGLSEGEATVFQDLWQLPGRGKDVR